MFLGFFLLLLAPLALAECPDACHRMTYLAYDAITNRSSHYVPDGNGVDLCCKVVVLERCAGGEGVVYGCLCPAEHDVHSSTRLTLCSGCIGGILALGQNCQCARTPLANNANCAARVGAAEQCAAASVIPPVASSECNAMGSLVNHTRVVCLDKVANASAPEPQCAAAPADGFCAKPLLALRHRYVLLPDGGEIVYDVTIDMVADPPMNVSGRLERALCTVDDVRTDPFSGLVSQGGCVTFDNNARGYEITFLHDTDEGDATPTRLAEALAPCACQVMKMRGFFSNTANRTYAEHVCVCHDQWSSPVFSGSAPFLCGFASGANVSLGDGCVCHNHTLESSCDGAFVAAPFAPTSANVTAVELNFCASSCSYVVFAGAPMAMTVLNVLDDAGYNRSHFGVGWRCDGPVGQEKVPRCDCAPGATAELTPPTASPSAAPTHAPSSTSFPTQSPTGAPTASPLASSPTAAPAPPPAPSLPPSSPSPTNTAPPPPLPPPPPPSSSSPTPPPPSPTPSNTSDAVSPPASPATALSPLILALVGAAVLLLIIIIVVALGLVCTSRRKTRQSRRRRADADNEAATQSTAVANPLTAAASATPLPGSVEMHRRGQRSGTGSARASHRASRRLSQRVNAYVAAPAAPRTQVFQYQLSSAAAAPATQPVHVYDQMDDFY